MRVDELSFTELVHELSQFEHETGTPDLERAIRRRAIDQRLMRLLSAAGPPGDERRGAVRVPGDLPIALGAGGRELGATLLDLAEGGVRVRARAADADAAGLGEGSVIDVAIGPDVRANAAVMWRRDRDDAVELGLHFAAQAESQRRRLHRLVLEVLRRMPAEPAGASAH